MGGIKNHIQQIGLPLSKGFDAIEDPIERHMAFMKQQATPYCKGCGKQILNAQQDESGAHVDYETEQKRQLCTKCYNELMEEMRLKSLQAKRPQETDWEELKKKYVRE